MTTETSVIYIVSSLNKVHILKAIHRVPFHHVTIPWFRITKNPATLNLVTMFNEMVYLGIQILVSTYLFSQSQNSKYSKCQDLPNFEFSEGGGYSPRVKTQNTLSAKICLILNFLRGGYSPRVKTQNTLSAKICLILNFRGRGVFSQS